MRVVSNWRLVSLRHFRQHRLRTGLTVMGIAFGIAAMVALRLAFAPIARSYARTVESLSGTAAFQVTNGELGVPEALLEELRAVPGVRAASASVRGFLPLIDHPGDRVYLFAVDLVEDQKVRSYQFGETGELDDPIEFLAVADSVAVTTTWLREQGLGIGDVVRVLAPSGPTSLRVRATLKTSVGPASLFGGRLVVMDVYAAQRLLALDARFSQIEVAAEPGTDLTELERRLVATVGSRAVVEPARAAIESLERLLRMQQHELSMAALGAVVVGLSVILNAMMISVVQRRGEFATLRALGMERGDVVRLVLVEACALGTAGAVIGAPLGIGLAKVLSVPQVAQLGSAIVPMEALDVEVEAWPIVLGVALGFASALLAATVPAWEASSVAPLEALRRAALREDSPRPYRIAATGGLIVLAIAVAAWTLHPAVLGVYASAQVAEFGLTIGLLLLVPLCTRSVARRVDAVTGRLLGVTGTLASRGLDANMGRFATTGTVLVVCFAYVVTVSAQYATYESTFARWFESTFGGADLLVSSGAPPLSEDAVALPAALVTEVAAVPEVSRVGAIRVSKVRYGGSYPALFAIDASSLSRRLLLLDGDAATVAGAVGRGEGVVADEAFADAFHVRRGDVVRIPGPSGEIALPVLGISPTGRRREAGTLLIDLAHYRRLWSDAMVSLIEVEVSSPAAYERVAASLRTRFGQRHGVFVTSVARMRADLLARVRHDLAAVPPILAIALAIALLGLANSLLASVLDRVAEIGMLRAVGATRRQIARSIALESALMGGIGGLLAGPMGIAIAWFTARVLAKELSGISLVYQVPVVGCAAVAVASLALGAIAGWLPALSAARIPIADALDRA
jgi:putative ABC transport system permease protein